jgi:methanogenic corrinoid protein MtbC1
MNEQDAGRYILDHTEAIAEAVVRRHYDEHLERWEPYGPPGYEKSIRDVTYHLSYLAEALDSGDPSLFLDYLGWAKVLFAQLGFEDQMLVRSLRYLDEVFANSLPEPLQGPVRDYVRTGLEHVRAAPSRLPSELAAKGELAALSRQYLDLLLSRDRRAASRLILEVVEQGTPVEAVYKEVFQPVQREVGRLWQMNEISVAQEHYCTAATQLIMSQLYPYIFGTTRRGRRFLGTCVGGELHEIGVRMVTDFFEMDGWDTLYLGANTPVDGILESLRDEEYDLLGVSATMTYHVDRVESLIQAVRHADLPSQPYILVGGYPFNVSSTLWEHVGADGHASDAEAAIAMANDFVA